MLKSNIDDEKCLTILTFIHHCFSFGSGTVKKTENKKQARSKWFLHPLFGFQSLETISKMHDFLVLKKKWKITCFQDSTIKDVLFGFQKISTDCFVRGISSGINDTFRDFLVKKNLDLFILLVFISQSFFQLKKLGSKAFLIFQHNSFHIFLAFKLLKIFPISLNFKSNSHNSVKTPLLQVWKFESFSSIDFNVNAPEIQKRNIYQLNMRINQFGMVSICGISFQLFTFRPTVTNSTR